MPQEVESEEGLRIREEERKRAATEIVEEQLRREAELRAAGTKQWDDDEAGEIEEVDDTDGIDPEAERAAWKLRELRRVKREREAIEEAEKEREEIERRRNLSREEREEEDQQYLAQQKDEKDARCQMGFMQKYFHKGAFFQDDARDKGLDRRDIMGSRYADDVTNRELLPQYMQIRDMTRLGRKGRTKYKDLQSEDTGRWGDFGHRTGRPDAHSRDERFMADRPQDKAGATGATEPRRRTAMIGIQEEPTQLITAPRMGDAMATMSRPTEMSVGETTGMGKDRTRETNRPHRGDGIQAGMTDGSEVLSRTMSDAITTSGER